jgi:photosystem II stability/assembly factor-like uncharacterized protein
MRRLLFGMCALSLSVVLAPASVSAETVVAVGTELGGPLPTGGVASRPLVLRTVGATWERAALPDGLTGFLSGVVFAGPAEVWAYGMAGEGSPVLLRSRDAGGTWDDVSPVIPRHPAELRLDSLGFTDDGARGWLVARTASVVGPYVAATTDGGRSWTPFAETDLTLGLRHHVVARGATLELVRGEARGARLAALAPAPGSARALGMPSSFVPKAVAAAGDTLWLAGVQSLAEHGFRGEPSIYRIRGEDEGIEERLITVEDADGDLEAIDVRADGAGVAGGWQGSDRPAPLLLHSRDGERWWEGEVRPALAGMAVRGVVRSAGTEAWAVAHSVGGPQAETALLYTIDEGATWTRVPAPVEMNAQLFALARGPDR